MKKIFIGKNESTGEVIEKIAASVEADIVLVFPRHAKVRDSVSNFHVIKKEAISHKKNIIIESVDEEVLALAAAVQLEGIHPLFSGSRAKSLSDIVPSDGSIFPEDKLKKGKRGEAKKSAVSKKTKKVSLRVTEDSSDDAEEELEDAGVDDEGAVVETYEEVTVSTASISEPNPSGEYDGEKSSEDGEEEYFETYEPSRRRSRWPYYIAGLLLIAGGTTWALGALFSRADVTVNFRTNPWSYEGELTALRTAEEANGVRGVIPAESFTDSRTITQLFKASGRAEVEQRAKARVTIYNAYSSQSQILVATTRFLTPDGKLYRLEEQVEIPGAEIKDGKIIPSRINAQVTADRPGPDFNTGPIERLSIPGFQGTAKFEGFYGAFEEGARDGFIGERAVPTKEDIAAARARTTEILRSSLQSNILSRRPADFKILDGAMSVEVVRLTVNENTDQNGNFSVFGEARFRAIGFRESDVREILLDAASAENPDMQFHELNVSYENPKANFEAGRLEVTVKATGSLVAQFSEAMFRSDLAGRDLFSAREMVSSLEGRSARSESKISLWPLWVRRLPADTERINLQVGYESAE